MKIRHPLLVAAAGRLAAGLTVGLGRTLRFEFHAIGTVVTAPIAAIPPGPRYVYALWHEYLLLPVARVAHPDLAALVSQHADGQILGTVLTAVGMGMVKGSSTRGGAEALRQIVRGTAGRRHLVVTPDGPRGPRRVVQPGVAYTASRTGMRVVPVGIGYQKAFRLKSWDRFAVPRPGCRAKLILGAPIPVDAAADAAALDGAARRVQADLDRLTAAAEAWAVTGVLDVMNLTGVTA